MGTSRCGRKVSQAFKRANVPLMIWWGHKPHGPRDDKWMKKYIPTKEEVDRSKAMWSRQPVPIPRRFIEHYSNYNEPYQYEHDGFSSSAMPSTGEGGPPEPMRGSLQQPGETVHTFMDRLEEEQVEYECNEEPQDSARHLELMQEAEAERRDKN